MKFIYIFCFSLLALLSPKLNYACSDHQKDVKEKTECTTEKNHQENSHSCCDSEKTDHSNHQESNNSCGESSNCCCPMMANHSCCLYHNATYEFNFNIPLFKEELYTLMLIQETSGFSSIFIPPKIA